MYTYTYFCVLIGRRYRAIEFHESSTTGFKLSHFSLVFPGSPSLLAPGKLLGAAVSFYKSVNEIESSSARRFPFPTPPAPRFFSSPLLSFPRSSLFFFSLRNINIHLAKREVVQLFKRSLLTRLGNSFSPSSRPRPFYNINDFSALVTNPLHHRR